MGDQTHLTYIRCIGQRHNKNEILPHLSVAIRDFISKSSLIEVINAILYKLKTGR